MRALWDRAMVAFWLWILVANVGLMVADAPLGRAWAIPIHALIVVCAAFMACAYARRLRAH